MNIHNDQDIPRHPGIEGQKFGVKDLLGRVKVCRIVKKKGDVVVFRDARGVNYCLPADCEVFLSPENPYSPPIPPEEACTTLGKLYEQFENRPGECYIQDYCTRPLMIIFSNYYEGAEYFWPEGAETFIEGNLAVATPSQ